jgi:hypothetical protein
MVILHLFKGAKTSLQICYAKDIRVPDTTPLKRVEPYIEDHSIK